MNLSLAKKVAETAALKAGDFLKTHQHKVTIKKHKEREDIQTDADLTAEKIIIDTITKTFPSHNIESEEAGIINRNSEYTWVIDPLDGTKEYFRGLPLYSTCISCEKKNQLLVGCVYVPVTNELFSAAKSKGAFQNHTQSLQVSVQPDLNHSFVAVHPPNYKLEEPSYSRLWQTIASVTKQVYRIRPTPYDNIILCHLAKGGYDGYFVLFEQGPQWHDLAPGLVIAQEAGAKITDRFGHPLVSHSLDTGLVVTNGKIHSALLDLIGKSYPHD